MIADLLLLDRPTVWSFCLQNTSSTGRFTYGTFRLLNISSTNWTFRLQGQI